MLGTRGRCCPQTRRGGRRAAQRKESRARRGRTEERGMLDVKREKKTDRR
ncbi:hypothetical protein PAMP_013026 [Pampus punctatissimus]